MHASHPQDGELCHCGALAVVAFETNAMGRVPFCGRTLNAAGNLVDITDADVDQAVLEEPET